MKTQNLLKSIFSIAAIGIGFLLNPVYAQTSPAIAIVERQLPKAEIGMNYRTNIYANLPATEWSITGLPSYLGYSWDDNYCTIYGMPMEAGTFTLTVAATNGGTPASRNFTIVVEVPKSPIITTTAMPKGYVGEDYYLDFRSTSESASWSIIGGNLPPGLSFDNGSIRGTPEQTGSSTFTVKATNGIDSDTKEFTIAIGTLPKPVITFWDLSNIEIGGYYWGRIEAEMSTSMSIEGSLPPGLSHDCWPSSCYIEGTPTQTGTFSFTVKATNTTGTTPKELSITIEALKKPTIITGLPKGYVGEEYQEWFRSASQIAEWSIIEGNLPSGLSFNSNGSIFGTPEQIGSSTFTVKATNGADSDTKEITIVIEQPLKPVILTASLPNAEVGVYYGENIEANADWSIVDGSLPPGLDISWRRIEGMPTQAGTFSFTIEATKAVDNKTTKEFTIVVAEVKVPTITTANLSNGYVGENYYKQLESASGFAYWSIIDGSLPPGLSFGSSGWMWGTPAKTGSFTFTIEATNSAGSHKKQFTIVIDPQSNPVIATANMPKGYVGEEYYKQLESASESAEWDIIAGSLPQGLILLYGSIYGYPEEAGTFKFTVKATNGAGSKTKELSIVIGQPRKPVFSFTTLQNGVLNEDYNGHIWLENDASEWNLKAGSSLPPGLALSYYCEYGQCAFRIFGVPTEVGDFNFTIVAKNAAGSTEQKLSIKIASTLEAPTISGTLPKGVLNEEYMATLTSESPVIWWTLESGDLPPGLYFHDQNGIGIISGVPKESGTFNFTVRAMNAAGVVTKQFSITVDKTSPIISAIAPNANSLKAWTQSGVLYMSGLTAGKAWGIYTAKGTLVRSGLVSGAEMSVSLNMASGIYFVKTNGQTLRIVYK